MSSNTGTVRSIVEQAARVSPNSVAVVSPEGQPTTYAALLDRGRRLASALVEEGATKGARIAAWMEDCTEYVELYVACALAGLVVVPINARFTGHEAKQILTDSGAHTLVFTGAMAQHIPGVLDERPELRTIGVRTGAGSGPVFESLISSASGYLPVPEPLPGDLYIIGYTSGTTGTPKGAMLTQGSVACLAQMNALSYRLVIGSVAAMTGSMSFVAVVPSHIISHFYVRGTVRLLGHWDVAGLLDVVESTRATFTYIPSPMIDAFVDAAVASPEKWQSLQTVLHSASKASPDRLRRLARVIGYRFVEGWGMTEHSGGLMTATTPADAADPGRGPDRLATVGRPVPGVMVEVVGHDGDLLPHDGTSVGELVVSSPATLVGYWNRPEASAAVLRDGCFHTGDLGSIDPDGYVSISDRRVDLIVSGGMNVYPFEVENCIARLAGVDACAVVGVPHPRWGQTVVAVVVRTPGAALTESDIVEHCRHYLASYKKPTRVVFVDELPRTTSLKVSRAAVREMVS